MPRLSRLLFVAVACLSAAGALAPAAAHAQSTRTWVSGVGNDADPCSRTAPCKTFAGAISKTAAGGEINAVDPGGFGAVTITKPITIDASSTAGGVLNAGSNGVIVNAAATDDVILRGLDIDGAGCAFGGVSGIRVLKAHSVVIENSLITHQQKAIDIASTSPVNVLVNHVSMPDNCTLGVGVASGAGGSANVAIQDSTISNSGTAVSMGAGGSAWLTRTTLFGNALAYQTLSGGAIADYGDNRLIANTADGAAAQSLAAATVQGSPGPQGPAGPAGPQGAKGDPAIKLLIAAASDSLTAKAGAKVALRYAATADAASTLTVTLGKKTWRPSTARRARARTRSPGAPNGPRRAATSCCSASSAPTASRPPTPRL